MIEQELPGIPPTKNPVSIKTCIHIEQIFRNKMLNPNPFDLTEEEFEKAKKIAGDLVVELHREAGHSIRMACSATLFLYESLLTELKNLSNNEPQEG